MSQKSYTYLCALFLASALIGSNAVAGWRTGRATFYSAIHHGSCGYGPVDPNEGLGLNIAAMPDAHPDYEGVCGSCYEVKCHPMDMYDRYGGELKRSMHNVCKDPNRSVVVKIIDTCPCDHNHKWCCGDMDHFDLSKHAFLQLTDEIWGVIALKYRKVSCDHDVKKTSPLPSLEIAKSFDPLGEEDTKEYVEEIYEEVEEVEEKPLSKKARKSSKAKKSSKTTKTSKRENSKSTTRSKVLTKVAKAKKDEAKPIPAPEPTKKRMSVFDGEFKNGFMDGGLVPYTPLNAEGFSKRPGWCTNVSARRGVAIVGGAKKFSDAMELEFWVKENWGTPDFEVSLVGKKGLFNPVRIQDLETVSKDYAANLHLKAVPMDKFLEGSKQKLEDAHSIVFINPLDWDQGLCVDSVKIAYPLSKSGKD